jgi:hypothetical protein
MEGGTGLNGGPPIPVHVYLPDRLYIRAFARSQQRDLGNECISDSKGWKRLFRYAYTNPISTITLVNPHTEKIKAIVIVGFLRMEQ